MRLRVQDFGVPRLPRCRFFRVYGTAEGGRAVCVLQVARVPGRWHSVGVPVDITDGLELALDLWATGAA